MAQPTYKPVLEESEGQPAGLSPAQSAAEEDARQAASTLLNIEGGIRYTDKARREVEKSGRSPNLVLALREAAADLEATRKKLFQATHFGGDQHRLL